MKALMVSNPGLRRFLAAATAGLLMSAAFAPVSLAQAPAADTPPESTHGPLPILPDDLRQPTRPEDFLPYFQLPGPGVNPGVPAPAPLPPSSATYTQTPR